MSVVADAARRWVGTPFAHGASVRGAGCDCLGLLRGVWREVVGPERVTVPPYAPDWMDRDDRLARGLASALRSVPSERSLRGGDVLLMRLRDRGPAAHVGIVSSTAPCATFIHAYSGRGVVASRLSEPWMRRAVERFEFPLED